MTEEQIREIVRAELMALLGEKLLASHNNAARASDWLPTKAAAQALGIAPGTLLKWRPQMKAGRHYRYRLPTGSSRAGFEWHLPAVRKFLKGE